MPRAKSAVKRLAYRLAYERVQMLLDAGGIWEDVEDTDPSKVALIAELERIAQELFEKSDLGQHGHAR